MRQRIEPWPPHSNDDIDQAWAAHPKPGRIGAVHRLNRTEYTNAIRDLFALDLDVRPLLPGDETADGSFDNLADALSISTAHLERYLSVARQVTRLAMGLPPTSPRVETFEIPIHVIQDDRQSEDLPFGSRGGIAIPLHLPGRWRVPRSRSGCSASIRTTSKGMGWPQQLDVRLDGKLMKRFTVGGDAKGRPAALSYAGDGEPGFAGDPEWEKYMQMTGDAGLEVRITGRAPGRMSSASSFVRELWEPEGLPHPPQRGRTIANDNDYMGYANVGSVQIAGPYQTASGRRRTRQAGARSSSASPALSPTSVRARRRSCRKCRASRLSPAGDEDASVQTLLDILRSRTPGRSELRRRHSAGARASTGRSRFPAARVSRSVTAKDADLSL